MPNHKRKSFLKSVLNMMKPSNIEDLEGNTWNVYKLKEGIILNCRNEAEYLKSDLLVPFYTLTHQALIFQKGYIIQGAFQTTYFGLFYIIHRRGAPGWLSQLSIWLRLRSQSQDLWAWSPHWVGSIPTSRFSLDSSLSPTLSAPHGTLSLFLSAPCSLTLSLKK